jgi:1-acyl-sn-glycerol-3-phosphate acyltransferase
MPPFKRQFSIAYSLALIMTKTVFIVLASVTYLPTLNTNHQQELIRKWIKDYLRLLGVSAEWVNADNLPSQPFMFVANHISWLDFFVLQSLKPSKVVAKSDIAKLPLIGSLATLAGIIFTDRNHIFALRKTNAAILKALEHNSVCIFPEGTTHLSGQVMSFKSSLLEPALAAGVPVIPLAIKYVDEITGNRTEAPAYFHVSFGTTLVRILRNRPIKAILVACPPLSSRASRKEIANYCQNAIYNHLN